MVSLPAVTVMPVAPPEQVMDPSEDVPVSETEYPVAEITGRISKVGRTWPAVKGPGGNGIVPETSSAATAFVTL
jgi:hypothetical protein